MDKYDDIESKIVDSLIAIDPSETVSGLQDLAKNVQEKSLDIGHHPAFWTEATGNFVHSYDVENPDGSINTIEYVVDADTIDRMRHFYGMKLAKNKYGKWPAILSGKFHEETAQFKINNNDLTYWLALKPQPIKLSNLDYVITPKMWANAKETHGHLQGNYRELN